MCDSITTEEWKSIPGWDGFYNISDQGQIKSLARTLIRSNGVPMRVRERILRQGQDTSGYQQIALRRLGEATSYKVHILVALTFIGPRPPGMEVMHLDSVKSHNYVSNLAYGTRSENLLMCVDHGDHNMARKTHCPQEHEYTPENTYISKAGSRMCRTCSREKMRYRRANGLA
jgi:hypothetical protein